jgi:DNA mismatch endonuclease (patch repair protein)
MHAEGFRFRLHRRDLPGSPDIVLVSRKIAIFVDGCFWHGCPKHSVIPTTNNSFWSDKIEGNQKRDKKATKELRKLGWCVVRVWEHDLKKDVTRIVRSIDKILQSRSKRHS